MLLPVFAPQTFLSKCRFTSCAMSVCLHVSGRNFGFCRSSQGIRLQIGYSTVLNRPLLVPFPSARWPSAVLALRHRFASRSDPCDMK
jgi:hypothetical protein